MRRCRASALAPLAGALILAGATASPAAASEPPPPPATAGIPAPPEPGTPPEVARTALQLLRGKLDGLRLTLAFRCGASAHVDLSVAGRTLADRRLVCRDSRARLSVELSKAIARRAAKRGVRSTVTARIGEWRTSLPLELGRTTRYARAAFDSNWTIQAAWCTNYGFQASVDTATRLGANYGEQVWWRPVGWQHETQSWSTTTYLAGYGLGSNLWDKYTAVPDNDILITGTGSVIFYGNAQVRSLGLWTTRTGVWVAPAIQSWTARSGYQTRYIRTTTTNGYGEALSGWCYVPR